MRQVSRVRKRSGGRKAEPAEVDMEPGHPFRMRAELLELVEERFAWFSGEITDESFVADWLVVQGTAAMWADLARGQFFHLGRAAFWRRAIFNRIREIAAGAMEYVRVDYRAAMAANAESENEG